jgi:hypothetical protein
MAKRTPIYSYYTLQVGDKWYPGFDEDNMRTADNEAEALYRFVGPGVIDGWDVVPFDSTYRLEQVSLIQSYISNPDSTLGRQLQYLGLKPTIEVNLATTANIALSGALTIDGTLTTSGSTKVLVKNQTNPDDNGIYQAQSGSWTRIGTITSETITLVLSGNSQSNTLWVNSAISNSFVLGSDPIYFADAFTQCVRVSPGKGIVGIYPARTSKPSYFRMKSPDIYYAWAESSFCLQSEGIAAITVPESPDEEWDQKRTATYLASIELANDNVTEIPYVLEILYGDRRNVLKNLAGALQNALRKAFYRHVHLGAPDNPSKINLSTHIVLNASGPTGSTIFQLKNASGNVFTWSAASYGVPEVRLNNTVLPDDSYVIQPSSGKIFLKNSISDGASLQVILPLAAQKSLRIHQDYSITSPIVFLTDGTTQNDTDGNPQEVIFLWSNSDYHFPEVYLGGIKLTEDLYTAIPERGAIVFKNPDAFSPALSSYSDSDLVVILTRLGNEITGKLSGKRLTQLNAASFNRGTLDPRRLSNLDHVGETRFKQPAKLIPVLRVIPEGDHKTFYPEIPDSPLQFGTDCYQMYISQNFAIPTLIGSKRGLIQTSDFVSSQLVSSWPNDRGRVEFLVDDILQADDKKNYFKTTWALTKEGRVWSTKNQGLSWQILKQPISGLNTAIAKSFWASTQRDEIVKNFFVEYEWSSNLYLGSDIGLYSVNIREGQTESEWVWTKLTRYRNESNALIDEDSVGDINAVFEMTTLNTTTNQDTGEVTKTFNRNLYVGTETGLYVGGSGEVRRVFSGDVKGFHWIRNGVANNNLNDLLWWTDTDVYISHSARFEDDGSGTTTWINPLLPVSQSFTDVRVATSTNINLSAAPNVLDGITLLANDRILVKNQSDLTQNGIYFVQTLGTGSNGVWVRSLDADANGEFVAYKTVKVTAGTALGGSTWYLNPESGSSSYLIGTTDINWRPSIVRVYRNLSAQINNVAQRESRSSYLIGHSLGISVADDIFTSGNAPSYAELPWDSTRMGGCAALLSLSSASSDEGVVFAASDRGVWKSTDALWNINLNIKPWTRTRNEFYESSQPSIYDALTASEITSGFTLSESEQSIVFDSTQQIWKEFVYERDYRVFHVAPWNPTDADVVVYINDQPSLIPYGLDAAAGTITFTESLSPADAKKVTITIVRDGAFISNVGETPHEELLRTFLVPSSPTTRLARRLVPADLTILVEDIESIPVTARYIEIRSSSARERITISVDPETREISIPYARTTQNTFEVNASVYVVEVGSKLGIEDKITLAQSNLTYHLASVDNANTIKLGIKSSAEYPGLFDNYYGTPTTGTKSDRGLKKSVILDLTPNTGSLDSRVANSALFTGVEPSALDSSSQPQAAYAIHNASATGEGMYVGTDKGIWLYSSGKWIGDSPLGQSSRTYFVKSINSKITTGADTGVWQKGTTWVPNPTYPQTTFDHTSGSWFGGTFEAWGKDDGLAFVTTPANSTVFTSDHFDPVDGRRVYGLYKDQFIRLITDSNGNTTQEKVDALYLCTEDGLYGVTNGTRGGTFSSVLAGREMFAGNVLNVKFYKIFKAPSTPPSSKETIPLLILSNNGIYRVRNWRWCDPTDANSLDFYPESHFLEGISCYCFATSTKSDIPTPPGLSKCFVGTDRGVYRSFTEGASWQACERIEGGDTAVYDLKIFNSTFSDGIGSITREVILAATELGLHYTIDDGDTWYRAGQPTSDGWYPVTFGAAIESRTDFSGGWLAQTFQAPTGTAQITKIGLYVSLRELPESDPRKAASQNNTLTAYIYNVDSNGKPTTQVAYSSSGTITSLISAGYLPTGFTNPDTLTASDVTYPGFKSLYLPVTLPDPNLKYAVVIRETIALGGTSIFQWQLSNVDNPYTSGEALIGGVTPVWNYYSTARRNDFFFRVHFQANSVPILTNVPVGFYDSNSEVGFLQGTGRGFVVKDSGYLTTDSKFAMALVVDDSASQSWSDPLNRRDVEIGEIISDFWTRTDTTVDGQPYSLNYGDFWQFGTSIQNRSTGYTSDANKLINYAVALKERGNNSELMETVSSAIAGLSPQAIIESVLQAGDLAGNQSRVSTLVQYHSDRGILRLEDIRDWYAAQPNVQVQLEGHAAIAPNQYNLRLPSSGSNFLWSSLTYPYVEVLDNNSLVDPIDYSINPSTGVLTTLLTVTDLVVNLRVDWDGTEDGISASDTASLFVVERWAKSFLPAALIFADGDNSSTTLAETVAIQANSTWDDDGIKLLCFALGRSHFASGLKTLANDTNGQYFDISNGVNGQDWDTAADSLLHGGTNSLFKAHWNRVYDFTEPTWIKEILAVFDQPTGAIRDSSAIVKFRWTQDRLNWSSWMFLDDGIFFDVNELLLGIEYDIELQDGWTGTATVRPEITLLYHVAVTPSKQYLVTQPYDIDGMLFEHILSSESNLPREARMTWGISRGDSTDWAYFEPVFNHRNGALANRQQSILFTKEITRSNLKTTTTDNLVYQVYEENSALARWTSDDLVQVRVDGIAVQDGRGAYALDGDRGLVYFDQELPAASVVTVTIASPSRRYISEGEATSTVDGRTYSLSNGKWPFDSSIVVLVNGVIKRGGYFANNEEGTITFTKELSRTDIVTVFVQPSGKFRIGVEIENYSTSPVSISSCGLFYTTLANADLVFRSMNTLSPTIEGDVTIVPDNANIYQRMQASYVFKSVDGNTERGTKTNWYRKRGGGSFLRVGPENGLPNYENRTIERLADLAGANSVFLAGDEVYIDVIPSDGITEGQIYSSDSIILRGVNQPYVFDVSIAGVNKIERPASSGIFYVPPGQELRARFTFNDNDGGGDIVLDGAESLNIVNWYTNDSVIPIHTGPRLPLEKVTKGRVISFVVTPKDTDDFGNPVESDEVTVQ